MKKILTTMSLLLALIMVSCSSDGPVMSKDDGGRNSHRALSVKEVHGRLIQAWSSIAQATNSTRSGNPSIDSIITVPGGDVIGVVDDNFENLLKDANLEYVDTVNNYALAFTFKNADGFVIMSMREGLPDVLYYGESGSYTESLQSNFKTGFNAYMDQLTAWVDLKLSADPEDDGAGGDDTWTTIAVVKSGGNGIPVNWGQEVPFNGYCPGKYTGCLATALAQLMAYHQYPASYNGCSFNWEHMIKIRDNDLTKRLMAFLGEKSNLDLIYTNNGSLGLLSNVLRTLSNFGYDGTARQVHYNFITFQTQIDNNLPVIMQGCCRGKTTGHAWVSDGYMIRKRGLGSVYQYVRCNWGYDGKNNGYALSEVFDPENTIPEVSLMSTSSNQCEDCDPMCGDIGELTSTAHYRKNHMIINIRPIGK